MILNFFLGFLLSGLVGLVGYWRGSLSLGGVVGAILIGTPVFGFGGVAWGGVLVVFFLSSSVLSHYRFVDKAHLAEKFQKGAQRDLGQALANGGWAAAIAVLFGVWNADWLFVGFVGALATVTADTWATEIGVLSPIAPRLITNWKSVPVGTSGGITTLGTMTALLGSAFIGFTAVAIAWLVAIAPGSWAGVTMNIRSKEPIMTLLVPASIGGISGSLFDSFLGATAQAIYYCDLDRKETERRIHSCGRRTRLVRGYAWLDSDGVNFLASILGSAVAVVVWALSQIRI